MGDAESNRSDYSTKARKRSRLRRHVNGPSGDAHGPEDTMDAQEIRLKRPQLRGDKMQL